MQAKRAYHKTRSLSSHGAAEISQIPHKSYKNLDEIYTESRRECVHNDIISTRIHIYYYASRRALGIKGTCNLDENTL